MTLEEVLQNYFGLNGSLWLDEDKCTQEKRWTQEGYVAYNRLTDLIYDLAKITDTFEPNEVIDDLDKLEYIND